MYIYMYVCVYTINVVTDEDKWPKLNVNTEQRDEIGVAAQI